MKKEGMKIYKVHITMHEGQKSKREGGSNMLKLANAFSLNMLNQKGCFGMIWLEVTIN